MGKCAYSSELKSDLDSSEEEVSSRGEGGREPGTHVLPNGLHHVHLLLQIRSQFRFVHGSCLQHLSMSSAPQFHLHDQTEEIDLHGFLGARARIGLLFGQGRIGFSERGLALVNRFGGTLHAVANTREGRGENECQQTQSSLSATR